MLRSLLYQNETIMFWSLNPFPHCPSKNLWDCMGWGCGHCPSPSVRPDLRCPFDREASKCSGIGPPALLPLPLHLVSRVFLPDLAHRPPQLTVTDSLPPPSIPPPHHTYTLRGGDPHLGDGEMGVGEELRSEQGYWEVGEHSKPSSFSIPPTLDSLGHGGESQGGEG